MCIKSQPDALQIVSTPGVKTTKVTVETLDMITGQKQLETLEILADGSTVITEGCWPPLKVQTINLESSAHKGESLG